MGFVLQPATSVCKSAPEAVISVEAVSRQLEIGCWLRCALSVPKACITWRLIILNIAVMSRYLGFLVSRRFGQVFFFSSWFLGFLTLFYKHGRNTPWKNSNEAMCLYTNELGEL